MAHRILVADDDPAIREVLESYLAKGLGYAVTCVDSGHAAIEAAMGESFDLAILDVRMPDLSGSETYNRLRSIRPDLEAIFFTADRDFERTMDFMRFALPSERVLVKPLEDMGVLTRLIIGILGPPVR